MPRRIVLFTRDAGLTVALRTLLPVEDRVMQFESPEGQPGELDPASDTLVLDLPGDLRRGAYRSIREWFAGRVVVLLSGPPDRSFDGEKECRVLLRPFQLEDLIRELVVPPGAARRRTGVLPGPARQEPGRQEPGRQEPGRQEPGRQEPGRQEPGRQEPGRQEPGGQGAAGPLGPVPGGPLDRRRPHPTPPPGRDAARARFPGGVDRPSRTASPGTPEKVAPDAPEAAGATPGGPAERPPPRFDWFASGGRRPADATAGPASTTRPGTPESGAPRPTRRAPPPTREPQPPPDPVRPAGAPRPAGSVPAGPTKEAPAASGPERPAGPGQPPGPTKEAPAASGPERPASPPQPPGPTKEAPAASGPERPAGPPQPPGATKEAPAPSGAATPTKSRSPGPAEEPAAGEGGRPSDRPRPPGGEDAAPAAGTGLPKRVVDLRTGAPIGHEPAADGPPAAPLPEPWRVGPPVGTPATAGWPVAAGQPGERVMAPLAEGWAGPAPASVRVLVALLLGGLAVLVSGLFSTRSPEVGAGEAAIAQVVRGAAGGAGIAWRGQPVLDQPPLALAAHATWLLASGRADGGLVQTVQQARLSSSAFRGLATALLVLLVLALTERRRDTLLRFAIAAAAGLVAAVDPVLAGAGRVLTVESVGLAAALAALLLAWLLHERRAAVFVPAVGLASGAALLADGRSLVLLLVPLAFALLARGRQRVPGLAGRALAALLVGAGFWAAFAAWVVRAPGAAGLGQRLDRLAALAHLAPADRAPPLSRPLDLVLPRDLATVAVLALAVPALLVVWRRGERASRFLAAWNLVGLAAGGLLAALGAMDGSWLVYLVPGAVAAVALGLGAFRDLLAGRGAWARRAATVTVSLAVLALVVAGGRGWDGRYGHADDALARMARLVAAKTPACSALNAGDPADPDLFAVGQRRVTAFADGWTALASGVRYFLQRGGGAAGGGGLAGWLGANGRQVAAVPSRSLGTVRLWEVQQPSSSRVADLRRVPGGAFENVVGSACGGFAVVDGGNARFWSGYQAIGGKPVVGRALSRPWRNGAGTVQAFDTMVLGSVPDPQGGQPLARPVDLLARMTRQAPRVLAAAGMPKAESAPPRTIQERRRLLTEPGIARFYLGMPAAAALPVDWQLAAARFGAPVSPPRRLPGGAVRQAFEDVVVEADGHGTVRLAPLGVLAVKAGMVPAEALRPEPVPGLPPPGGRYAPASDLGLGLHLAAALGLWALLTLALALVAWLRRDRAGASAASGPAPPRHDGPGHTGARRPVSTPAAAGEKRAT